MLTTEDYTTGVGNLYNDGSLITSGSSLVSTGSTENISASAVVMGSYDIGAGNTDMSVAEHMVGNASVSSTEVDKLYGYAAWKWGLQGNLPSGHPYKTAPPTV